MPCQVKTEPLEYLQLETAQQVIDSYNMLRGIGYAGTLFTEGEVARIHMTMPDAVTVEAAVGDVILYKTSPAPAVVDCVSAQEFTTGYDIL